MKLKFCILCLLLLSAEYTTAQQVTIGIINFKAGVGLTQQDVDGVSAIFTTYFLDPEKYTIIERTQIDKIIEEQNLQRSTLTDNDMVRIGKILNLSYIIVGDINLVMGEYNIDVRLINVENGSIMLTDGASWTSGMSYRNVMQKIAEGLKSGIIVQNTYSRSELNAAINQLNKAIDNGLYEEAIGQAQKIQVMIPEHWAPFVILGASYRITKDYEKSSDCYNKALLLLDEKNFTPFDKLCDISTPLISEKYDDVLLGIYNDLHVAYNNLKEYEKSFFSTINAEISS